MFLLLASLILFSAVLAIFLSAAIPLLRMREEGIADTGDNAFTLSPFGPAIVLLRRINLSSNLESHRATLDTKLLRAGRPWGGAPPEDFLAAMELVGVGTFTLVAVLLALAEGPFTATRMLVATSVGVGAAWLFHGFLGNLVTDRQRAISRQFPFFLDLAVMTMESGSTFEESTEIYCRDNPRDALSQELRILLREVTMGKRTQEAFGSLIARVSSEEVQNSLRSIIQGLRMGTPLGGSTAGAGRCPPIPAFSDGRACRGRNQSSGTSSDGSNDAGCVPANSRSSSG